jgi:hypothetical protein
MFVPIDLRLHKRKFNTRSDRTLLARGGEEKHRDTKAQRRKERRNRQTSVVAFFAPLCLCVSVFFFKSSRLPSKLLMSENR